MLVERKPVREVARVGDPAGAPAFRGAAELYEERLDLDRHIAGAAATAVRGGVDEAKLLHSLEGGLGLVGLLGLGVIGSRVESLGVIGRRWG